MSNQNIVEDCDQFFSPLDGWDDLWPFYEEISAPAAHVIHDHDPAKGGGDLVNVEQQNLETQENAVDNSVPASRNSVGKRAVDHCSQVLDEGLKSMKISTPSSKTIIRKNKRKMINYACGKDDQGPSVSKKMDHNAKERIRRMRLNASYLALRALLPDSKRSKKRLGAPAIVDRVVKYIPELENEAEELKTKKENVQSAAAKNKKIIISKDQNPISSLEYQSDILTVSVNKVNEEEAIIQICMAKKDDNDDDGIRFAFTNMMQSVEESEGIICIKSASTNYVCKTRICYHLHIQIIPGTDYIEQLRDKVISWLR